MRKKVHYIVLIFLYIIGKANAQNLVPNYSFEALSCCTGRMDCINDWFVPNYSSPDHLSLCFWETYHFDTWSVPNNNWGYQYPHNGNGYVFIGSSLIPSLNFQYNEYISNKLIQPLKKDHRYCVEFYISVTEYSDCFFDDVGAFLSKDSLPLPSDSLSAIQHYYLDAQVSNPSGNILTDTAHWIRISGSFISAGGERFITIGSFRRPENIHFINYGIPTEFYPGLFIDDVSVYECNNPDFPANAGGNKSICPGDSVQLGTTNYEYYKFKWYPKTGLSDTTSGTPWVKPLVTTTYYLQQTNFFDTLTTDNVTIYVNDCSDAEAGGNRAVCKGNSIRLGSTNYAYNRYSWHPATGLSDTTSGMPLATPTVTTVYYLTQYSMLDSLSRDSVLVKVIDCDSMNNNVITIYPNPTQGEFYIEFSEYVPEEARFTISNALGQALIKSDIGREERKKLVNTSTLASGVYFCRVYAGENLLKYEKIVRIGK